MCLGKDTPRFGGEAQRVRQSLKHDVPILRPVAAMAERRQRERVGGVVRQIEAALDGEDGVSSIRKARGTGLDQVVEVAAANTPPV